MRIQHLLILTLSLACAFLAINIVQEVNAATTTLITSLEK